jgi:copper resistance protein B
VRFLAAAVTPIVLAVASPALAQSHDHSASQSQPPTQTQTQTADPNAMTMPQGSDSAVGREGRDMGEMMWPDSVPQTIPNVATSADNPGRPAETPPPPRAFAGPAFAAERYHDSAEMAAARERMRVENGDIRTSLVLFDRLETTFSNNDEGFVWDAQGYVGGDIHRFWWKSEGEGVFGEKLESADVQALYSRAVTPYFDLQTGLRQRYTPDADRTDLVFGLQGLAPYWFEIDVAGFVSNKGEISATAEAEYDLRLTQRLILQPRAEINLAAEDVPELAIGSGLSSAEFGLRLRYEIQREFAPYVGVEWSGRFGDTRDFVKALGEDAEQTRLVLGVRAWF